MAPPKKTKTDIQNSEPTTNEGIEDFSVELMKQINKEAGDQVAFNLGNDNAPTNVKRWISTGSRLVDYIIANKKNGGLPEGRIIELQGPPSLGKSHFCFEVAKATQKMGGLVAYFDTENATSPENLMDLGVDVKKNFIFLQTNCTEEVFKIAESIIMKSRTMTKDVPVTIIWDSVAACSPKAELEGDYADNTIGLQARVLSKGFRKISNIIANQKVMFLVVNQQRQKIGVSYGDPTTTPGGQALPYAASVRLRLYGGQPIKDGEKIIGITVDVKTIKNKVSPPFRMASTNIYFGIGLNDDLQTFDVLREYTDANKYCLYNGKRISVEGTAQWKYFKVIDHETGEIIHDLKFYKDNFGEKVLRNPEVKEFADAILDAAMVMAQGAGRHATLKGMDTNSLEEMRAQENLE